MKIARIALQNFRSHADTALDLGASPVTIIHGPNAAGKSSVLDAIHYALLGWCRGTDERGAGARNLVAEGAAAGIVHLALSSGEIGTCVETTVAAEITDKGTAWSLDGRSLPAAKFRGALDEERLRCDRDALHSCLDYHGFLSLHHSRQKEVLLGALGLDLSEMDRQYEDAKIRRAAAKKALQGILPAPVPQRPAEAMPTISEIETLLGELRAEKEGLVEKRGATVGRLEAVAADLQKVELRLKGSPSAATAKKAAADLEAVLEKLHGMRAASEAINKKVAELRAEKQRAQAELDRVCGAMDAISRMNGKCLVSPDLPCRITADEAARIAPTFEKVSADLASRIAAADAEISQQGNGLALTSIPETERKIEKLRAVVAAAADSQADQKKCSDLRKQLEEAKSFAGPGGGQLDAQIAELAERIQKGEVMLREARAAEGEAKSSARIAAECKRWTTELATAEADCERYGPNGERAVLIGQQIDPFLAEATEILFTFGLGTMHLSTEPWGITLQYGERELPAELLSTSEQLRLSLALQIALARVTGIGMVALDGAEILDDDGRAALLAVTEMGLVEQLIICTTTAADYVAPEIPGVQFVRVGVRAPAEVC